MFLNLNYLKSQLTFLILFSLLILPRIGYSQETEIQEEKGESLNKHSIKFGIGHAYISQGKIDGELKWLAAPTLALNYSYIINETWSIGLHNDIILESFIVEGNKSEEINIEREYPIATIIMSGYRISESFGVGLGGGIEWEKNRNFGLIRVGAEYGLEIKDKNLEVIFNLDYDMLIDAYDSINFGIGINKFFK